MCLFLDNALGIFYSGYFLFPSTRAVRVFFLISSPAGKTLKVWGFPKTCVSQEFLILRLDHAQPSAVCQNYRFKYFCYLLVVVTFVPGKQVFDGDSLDSLLFLRISGCLFALQTQLSVFFQKKSLIFCWSSFFLNVRTNVMPSKLFISKLFTSKLWAQTKSPRTSFAVLSLAFSFCFLSFSPHCCNSEVVHSCHVRSKDKSHNFTLVTEKE